MADLRCRRFRKPLERIRDTVWVPGTPREPGGEWFIFEGAWGDAMAAIGNARRMKVSPEARCLGVSSDPRITEWVCRQVGCAGGVTLVPQDWEWFFRLIRRSCHLPLGSDRSWLSELEGLAQIEPGRWRLTQVNYSRKSAFWDCPTLSDASLEWADRIGARLSCPVLVHAYSDSSTVHYDHWQGWPEAVRWLTNRAPVILTGRTWPHEWGRRPAVALDLIGRCDSNEQVLALASRCGRIVTTSNSLSMWSTIARIPALVMLNRVLSPESRPMGQTVEWWRSWVIRAPNMCLEWSSSQEAFRSAAERLIE